MDAGRGPVNELFLRVLVHRRPTTSDPLCWSAGRCTWAAERDLCYRLTVTEESQQEPVREVQNFRPARCPRGRCAAPYHSDRSEHNNRTKRGRRARPYRKISRGLSNSVGGTEPENLLFPKNLCATLASDHTPAECRRAARNERTELISWTSVPPACPEPVHSACSQTGLC